MRRYRIEAYVKVPDYDGSWIFDKKEEALSELEQLELMQPENIYKLVVINNNSPNKEQIEQDISYFEKD